MYIFFNSKASKLKYHLSATTVSETDKEDMLKSTSMTEEVGAKVTFDTDGKNS